jgi:hypothetical protein
MRLVKDLDAVRFELEKIEAKMRAGSTDRDITEVLAAFSLLSKAQTALQDLAVLIQPKPQESTATAEELTAQGYM